MAETVDIFVMVKKDLDARNALGWIAYGRPMEPFDGRDSLKDAYEEALDMVMYLKKAMVEREISREKDAIALRDNEQLRAKNFQLLAQLSAARDKTWYGEEVDLSASDR